VGHDVAVDHVDVSGLRIAFQRRGQGPALVLLHGAVCDGRVWRVELDAFSDEFTVVAWDAPGCGASSDPPDHFRMGDFAEVLTTVLDALELGPCHLLGHSWGSSLALEAARRRPDLVRTLVLVGAYAGWAGSLPPEEVEQRLAFALAAAQAPERFEPSSMRGLFSDAMPPERAAELARIMAEVHPSGTRTMALALAEADLRAVLPEVEVPVLIVAGEVDERSTLGVARALHAALPDSTLRVLVGLGHECYLESPTAFEAVVRPFLSSHR
jgi:pimeloyl-ACP methyl ester carboxylesterase